MKNYTFALSADQDLRYLENLLNNVQEISLTAIDEYEDAFTCTGRYVSLYNIIKNKKICGLTKTNKFFVFIQTYEYMTHKTSSLDCLSSITYIKEGVIEGNTFRLPNKKRVYRFDKDCNIQGNVLNVTLKRTTSGYSIDIITDVKCCWNSLSQSRVVGLDWGIRHFYTGSDFSIYESSHFYSEKKKVLRDINKKKESISEESLEYQELSEEYDRICNNYRVKRTDWQYWFSNQLCIKYDYIFLETLDYGIYTKRFSFREKIRDYGMKNFLEALKTIAKYYGTLVHEIDINYKSSKSCPCGYVYEGLGDKRYWECPDCHAYHDRDINAAQNIARQGIRELGLEDQFFGYLLDLSEDEHDMSLLRDPSISTLVDIPEYEERFVA